MRVTAATKSETRKQILECARRLFEDKGFEKATVRDMTSAADIALGTLFNYFASKEAVALAIISETLETAEREFHEQPRSKASLEELLFAHVAIGLRHLRACRRYVVTVFESTLSPLSGGEGCLEANDLRLRHLETVRCLLARGDRRAGTEPSIVTLHLYWTLYLGVLAFWAQDDSAHHEDTLALLDQSIRLFVATLTMNGANAETHHGT